MRRLEGRPLRAQRIRQRIASTSNDFLPRCTIPDPITGKACGRPTARAAKEGLNAFTCRYHQQHKQRHGSHWCKSPAATVLRPYVSAARKFIRNNRNDPYVIAALNGLGGIMASAGEVDIATRFKGLSPDRRAKMALARLRDAGIKPERLLAISLSVPALMEDAPEGLHRTSEWRTVAIAKAAHRLASGTHRRWPVAQPDGSTVDIVMHAYPRSSGRVLRHLGEMVEKECEWVVDKHLSELIALKRDADRSAQPAESLPESILKR